MVQGKYPVQASFILLSRIGIVSKDKFPRQLDLRYRHLGSGATVCHCLRQLDCIIHHWVSWTACVDISSTGSGSFKEIVPIHWELTILAHEVEYYRPSRPELYARCGSQPILAQSFGHQNSEISAVKPPQQGFCAITIQQCFPELITYT